ncbi:hypothetical protein QA612_06650 [Evansella sp. AB-P1]|uniref:hypothetical protein n=1 Tax=Evansella sp. AB-P1 TaxID=3037653 RepID=UPI00241C14CA|nr:hypothetical protein [Evansella sp. AB-P1]MDG5787166.1 hypothetical protein [Evansella sp. AB-P1]
MKPLLFPQMVEKQKCGMNVAVFVPTNGGKTNMRDEGSRFCSHKRWKNENAVRMKPLDRNIFISHGANLHLHRRTTLKIDRSGVKGDDSCGISTS